MIAGQQLRKMHERAAWEQRNGGGSSTMEDSSF